MLDVFERIVEQELNFGDVLQLVAEPLAQGAADEPVLVFEPLHHLAALLKGEDADVDFGVAEIGGYAYGGDRYERAAHDRGALLLEDFGNVLLDLLGDFLLTGSFHNLCFLQPEFEDLAVLLLLGSWFPGLEALFVEAVVQPHGDHKVVERRTQRSGPEGIFRAVAVVVVVFVAVADDVRITERVAHPEIQLETADQESDAAAARQSVAPAVVARELEGIVAFPAGGAVGPGLLVLVGGRDVVGEGRGRFEVDADVVAQHVEVRLPDDRQHDGIDMPRIVEIILLLLDLRSVGRKRKALLLELQINAEAPHEALLAVVAPRKAPAVKSPDRPHLLLGLEAAVAHAVAHREAERMLRRSPLPCGEGRKGEERRPDMSLHRHLI